MTTAILAADVRRAHANLARKRRIGAFPSAVAAAEAWLADRQRRLAEAERREAWDADPLAQSILRAWALGYGRRLFPPLPLWLGYEES